MLSEYSYADYEGCRPINELILQDLQYVSATEKEFAVARGVERAGGHNHKVGHVSDGKSETNIKKTIVLFSVLILF